MGGGASRVGDGDLIAVIVVLVVRALVFGIEMVVEATFGVIMPLGNDVFDAVWCGDGLGFANSRTVRLSKHTSQFLRKLNN